MSVSVVSHPDGKEGGVWIWSTNRPMFRTGAVRSHVDRGLVLEQRRERRLQQTKSACSFKTAALERLPRACLGAQHLF